MTEKLEDIKRRMLDRESLLICQRQNIMSERDGQPPVIANDMLNLANALANVESLYDRLLEHVNFALDEAKSDDADHSHCTSERAERLVSASEARAER